MTYDLQAIKDRLDLADVFRRDGHEPRRMGAGWFVCCPLHEEKSPSCKVEEKRFHCFGCGAGGDVFDYWERSRGLSRRDAIEQLANLAGIGPQTGAYSQPLARPAPRPAPEEIIAPLTADENAGWLDCVDALRQRPAEIARIAAWRGIDADVVRWAVERGIMGLKKWSGIWREAFLVEMPQAPSGPFVPVSTHLRLAPHTRGNDKPKQTWRFDPAGRGGWPLVFGTPHDCVHLFLLEGQWDALALVHLMGWHTGWPAGVCLVAMRGAGSFRKFLTHYAIHERAAAFAIADADNAGAEWFQPDGLVHQLSARVGRIHAFWPGERGKDLNDVVKDGMTRADMLAILRPKIANPHRRKLTGPTFLAWCRLRHHAPAPLGRAARAVIADADRPTGRKRKSVWERHWQKRGVAPDLLADLSAAWDAYKSECTPA